MLCALTYEEGQVGDGVVGTADQESHAQEKMIILQQYCAQTTKQVHQMCKKNGRLPSEAKVKDISEVPGGGVPTSHW